MWRTYRLQSLGYQPTRGVYSRNMVLTVSIFRPTFVFSAASSFTRLYIVPGTFHASDAMRALGAPIFTSHLEVPGAKENDTHRRCQADLDLPHVLSQVLDSMRMIDNYHPLREICNSSVSHWQLWQLNLVHGVTHRTSCMQVANAH